MALRQRLASSFSSLSCILCFPAIFNVFFFHSLMPFMCFASFFPHISFPWSLNSSSFKSQFKCSFLCSIWPACLQFLHSYLFTCLNPSDTVCCFVLCFKTGPLIAVTDSNNNHYYAPQRQKLCHKHCCIFNAWYRADAQWMLNLKNELYVCVCVCVCVCVYIYIYVIYM